MTRLADLTILSGLPVTIEYSVDPPDHSVGDPGGIGEWRVVALGSRPLKNPEWLHRKIAAKRGEEARILASLGDERREE